MSAIYQLYIESFLTHEWTSGCWFLKQQEAINYADHFHRTHPDLTIIVCRETFELTSDPKPYEITEIWRRGGK